MPVGSLLVRLRAPYCAWVRAVRRITTSGQLIPEIDGLRFLAIGAVFAHHVFTFVAGRSRVHLDAELSVGTVGQVVNAGHYGVQLFFIISGFILGLPFAAHHLTGGPPVHLGRYLLRRVTRLEPPYLLALALCFGVNVWVWHESAAGQWPHLLASTAYLHNFIFGTFSTVNPVAWSLEIEVQFYLAAPLLALVYTLPRRRLALAGLIAATMVLQTAFVPDGSRVYFSLAGFLHFFLAGLFLADVYTTDWRAAPQGSLGYDAALAACALAAALCATAVSDGLPLPRYLTHFLALGVLVFPTVAAFRSVLFRRLMGNSFLVSVGGMCYTTYLLHYTLLHLIGEATRSLVVTQSLLVNLLVHGAIFAPAVLAVSTCYFVAVEKPCMRKDWPVRLYRAIERLGMPRPEPVPADAPAWRPGSEEPVS